MANILIVAGGWRGGWSLAPIARRLRAQGHEVFTPTLTGLGERVHLASADTNLDTHIEDIADVIRFEDLRDVVLCGHSYAGMVISGVADRLAERVAALVYVDAFVPEDGESWRRLSQPRDRKVWRGRISGDAARTSGASLHAPSAGRIPSDDMPERKMEGREGENLHLRHGMGGDALHGDLRSLAQGYRMDGQSDALCAQRDPGGAGSVPRHDRKLESHPTGRMNQKRGRSDLDGGAIRAFGQSDAAARVPGAIVPNA